LLRIALLFSVWKKALTIRATPRYAVPMKIMFLALSVFFSVHSAFAQDQDYRQMPDGSMVYVGKCATHEDHLGKKFKVTGVILESVSTVGMKVSTAEKIVNKIGATPFRMMMKEYFDGLADVSTDQKMVSEFIDYADDLEIDAIRLSSNSEMEFLRFNVGFGGGNGGFLVLQKSQSGWKKISSTEDGDLKFCDSLVWGK
jgi:hypothetical protein